MAIWVTGDIHGDPSRLGSEQFPEGRSLTKDDFVIVLGDFGLVWDWKGESGRERYWLDWLESKPFTTLFVDGNHECHVRLDALPVDVWSGGKVHRVRPSVLHLMRGQIFDLQGKKFFTFGGASSHDISDGILEPDEEGHWKKQAVALQKRGKYRFRVNGRSWWARELPSEQEMREGLENLAKYSNKIDFVLTHSPYTSVLKYMMPDSIPDLLTDYLERVKNSVEYYEWYFGHMHRNQWYNWDSSACLYEQIIQIV